jgi:LuxR family maltose regulon positive regulatory protein
LATKLHIPRPRPRPGLVPRPHLLEQLGKGTASALTLVCAPAGFGRTSLLAEWARGRPEPVAWLSLDAGESDPARFWRYFAAALDGLRAGLAGQVGGLLDAQPLGQRGRQEQAGVGESRNEWTQA